MFQMNVNLEMQLKSSIAYKSFKAIVFASSILVSCCISFSKEVTLLVALFFLYQHYSKSYEQIVIKSYGEVWGGRMKK